MIVNKLHNKTLPLWIEFSPSKILPSLNSVQGEMGVPRAQRIESSPEGAAYTELVSSYHKLVSPRGCIVDITGDSLIEENLFQHSSETILHQHYQKAPNQALFIATIGSKVEELAASFMADGEYLKGCVLDSMASAGVEMVVDCLQREISSVWKLPCVRFSPGYGDWNLSVQEIFMRLSGAEHYGISLNDSWMFTPHKTVSGIIIPRAQELMLRRTGEKSSPE